MGLLANFDSPNVLSFFFASVICIKCFYTQVFHDDEIVCMVPFSFSVAIA